MGLGRDLTVDYILSGGCHRSIFVPLQETW